MLERHAATDGSSRRRGLYAGSTYRPWKSRGDHGHLSLNRALPEQGLPPWCCCPYSWALYEGASRRSTRVASVLVWSGFPRPGAIPSGSGQTAGLSAAWPSWEPSEPPPSRAGTSRAAPSGARGWNSGFQVAQDVCRSRPAATIVHYK